MPFHWINTVYPLNLRLSRMLKKHQGAQQTNWTRSSTKSVFVNCFRDLRMLDCWDWLRSNGDFTDLQNEKDYEKNHLESITTHTDSV